MGLSNRGMKIRKNHFVVMMTRIHGLKIQSLKVGVLKIFILVIKEFDFIAGS